MPDGMTVRQAESVRLMIDSTRLVNRLQDHIHGKTDASGNTVAVDLSATQIQAAKILLDKSLPSLQSADITAHSSPQIESEEALVAQLQRLIEKYPHLISQLTRVQPAIPAPEGGTQVGDEAVSAPHQPDEIHSIIPGHSER